MVKQKLVFQGAQNATSTKKKPQQTQQTKKLKDNSDVPQNGENGTAHHVVEELPTDVGAQDSIHNVAENNVSGKVENVDTPDALLRSHIRSLKKKTPKIKKLEEDIKTEIEFNLGTKKTKRNKSETPLNKEEEELQKQNELKLQQEQQKRQQQLTDTLSCVEVAQSTLDVLEKLQLSISKANQEQQVNAKRMEDRIAQLTKELDRKTKHAEEQTNTLRDVEAKLNVKSMQHSGSDKEAAHFRDANQILEAQLASYKTTQLEHLTQINELKEQLSNSTSHVQSQLNSTIQQKNQQEKQLRDVQHQLEQARSTLHLKDAELNGRYRELDRRQNEIKELQKLISSHEEHINTHQTKHKDELEHFKRTKEEEHSQKQKEVSHYKQQYQNALDTIQSMEQERLKLHQDAERMKQHFQHQQQDSEFQIAELKQKLQDQPPFFPVKFEEDILLEIAMRSELSKDEIKLKRLIKIIQIIDFFDLSKPDGVDIRNMFISDQAAQRREGKQVLIGSTIDLEAFDHFSRAIRGSQQNISNREHALIDGVRRLQKLLSNSNEEAIPGVTYQLLSDQIAELGSSNVYLTGRTEYPYRDNDSAFLNFNPTITIVPSTQKNELETTYVITSVSPNVQETSVETQPEKQHKSYSNDFNLTYNVTVPALPNVKPETKPTQQRGYNNWNKQQPRSSWAEESTEGTEENSETSDASPKSYPRKQYRGPKRGRGNSSTVQNRGGGSDRGTFRNAFRGGRGRGGKYTPNTNPQGAAENLQT